MSEMPMTPQDLPEILLGDRRLSDKTTNALEALHRANASNPQLFQQGGALVRLRFDDDTVRVEPLTVDALRGELDRVALWVKPKGGLAEPPASVVKNILSLPVFDLPRLRAVAEAPFFTLDGRLVVTPGYHTDVGVFLHLPDGSFIPPVPAV